MAKTAKLIPPVTAKPAPSFEDFFTRQASNEGTLLPLRLPTGEESPFWIRIRGTDSDAYRAAKSAMQRRMFEAAQKDKPEDEFVVEEREKSLLFIALVMDWNLPKPCTPENIAEFLREAPQIGEAINTLSTRRRLFFKQSLKPSESTLPQTSS